MMLLKRAIAVLISCALLLSGCSVSEDQAATVGLSDEFCEPNIEIKGLNDPNLQHYLEDAVYYEVLENIDTDVYCVEDVQVTYVSKEYLDESAYNSKENIYFGYTLSEVRDRFQGERYVFTVDENSGETVVKAFEGHDDTYEQVIRNIAIGGGVIFVCVTVSAVAGGLGVPAVSAIFAVSAKTGAAAALSGGVIGGAAAGIVTGYETGDMDEALKSAALAGSEGFMWGAIGGALTGGAAESVALHGATSGGLTMNEVALIQKESKYPLDVIKQFETMDQYEIFKDAGLETRQINGRAALIRDIDLNYIDEDGLSNLQRMQMGKPALDPSTGKSFELHHVGQRSDSTLAVLTEREHRSGESFGVLHLHKESDVKHDAQFAKVRKMFWKEVAELYA